MTINIQNNKYTEQDKRWVVNCKLFATVAAIIIVFHKFSDAAL